MTHTWANDIFSVGSGRSAIHWAAQSGHGKVVELLLQVAPLSACALDEKGVSPTDLAEKELQLDAMSALNHATFEEEWLILDLRLEDQLSRRIEVGTEWIGNIRTRVKFDGFSTNPSPNLG